MTALNKDIVLVLNAIWVPIGYISVRQALKSLFPRHDGDSTTALINVEFEIDKGQWDFNNAYFEELDWNRWLSLGLRDFDEKIFLSQNRVIRAPTVIRSKNCDKIPVKTLRSTKSNVLKRYGYRCAYTNKVFPKNELNIDHVIPKNHGGKDTWENLVPAHKEINTFKANRTPEQAGLKLYYKPSKPLPTRFFLSTKQINHPTWIPFLKK